MEHIARCSELNGVNVVPGRQQDCWRKQPFVSRNIPSSRPWEVVCTAALEMLFPAANFAHHRKSRIRRDALLRHSVYSLRADKFRSENLARQQIDREADIVVGDSENAMPVPDHQRAARTSSPSMPQSTKRLAATENRPNHGAGALDLDQLAAVLARLLEL